MYYEYIFNKSLCLIKEKVVNCSLKRDTLLMITRFLKHYLLTAAIFIFSYNPISLQAQIIQASLSHYSTDDGLTSNAVSDIIQDDYGFIWFATWNGLSRFDGYHFYNYETGPNSHIPFLHNRISEIKADHAQNIWMRMYDGRVFVLNRYTDKIQNAFENINGYQNFKTNVPLLVTSTGDVMIAVQQVGLYKMHLDKNGMQAQLYTTGKLKITTLTEGYQGDIWVGTTKGIHRLDKSNQNIRQEGLLNNEHIRCLYSDGYHIYLGTSSGKIYSFANTQDIKLIKDAGSAITSVFIDTHKLLWYSTTHIGISRLNLLTGDTKDFSQRIIVADFDGHGAVVKELENILWIRMNKGGFGYYNRATDEIEYFHNDPSNPWNLSNTVYAYTALPEGVIWMSTVRRGIEKLEILKKTILRTQLFPTNDVTVENEIRAMLFDKDTKTLWIGNKASQLLIIKNNTRTILTGDGKNEFGRIYGLMKDSKGNIWVSTKGNGLFKITPSTTGYRIIQYTHKDNDKNSLSSDNVYCTAEDKNGNIWVATYGGGVNLITTHYGKTIFMHYINAMHHYPYISHKKVRTLAADDKGNIWAGTSDGILIFTYKNKRIHIRRVIESSDTEHNLHSMDIVHIAKDAKGTMWIGTNGGGLSHTIGKDKTGNWLFETFGSKEGLPSEEIKSITFDIRGNVWFATDHIICSFDVKKHFFNIFTMLDGVDDTMCSEGSALSLPNGNILFGTLNGYYVVDRHRIINTSGQSLKLRITDFYLNDELITPRHNDTYAYYVPGAQEVKLPGHGYVFAFRFASLNYQLQHRVHYQYMLDGYDKEWKNADKGEMVSYSGVPSGTYTFKVRAFLLESPEKYDLKTIKVIVPPYFLLSSSAIWIYMVLAVIIILSLLYYHQERLARINNMRILKVGPQEIAFKHKKDYDFVKTQLDWLENKYSDSSLKIEDMVAQSSMSRTSYYNELKQLTGLSPKELISDFRLKKAMMFLEDEELTVAEIAYKTGFNDPVYFTRLFKSKIGKTPTKYREEKLHPEKVSTEENEYEEIIEEKEDNN